MPVHGARCQRILVGSAVGGQAASPSSSSRSAAAAPLQRAAALPAALPPRPPEEAVEGGERKRQRLEAKPVEARYEGNLLSPQPSQQPSEEDLLAVGVVPGEWKHFPSISAASKCTGTPNGSIAHLCDLQALHASGWRFRWPGGETVIDRPLRHHELELLSRRIRELPDAAARRNAVAKLPEVTRQQLSQHLRQGSATPIAQQQASRLTTLLDRLPEMMSHASDEKKGRLLEGVRTLQTIYCMILAAASVGDIAGILREVTPEQRIALMERLPEETNKAIIEHLTQEKNKASAMKAASAAAAAAVQQEPLRLKLVPEGSDEELVQEDEPWVA